MLPPVGALGQVDRAPEGPVLPFAYVVRRVRSSGAPVRSPKIVSASWSSARSTSSRATPASSHRMTRSSSSGEDVHPGDPRGGVGPAPPAAGRRRPARTRASGRAPRPCRTARGSAVARFGPSCLLSAHQLPPAMPGLGRGAGRLRDRHRRAGLRGRHLLLAQRLEEAVREPDHHQRERRPRDDRRLLQRVQPAGEQQRDRHAAHRRAPERDDRARRLEDPATGQHAHHDRGRVRAADEEHRDQHDHDDRRDRGERELLEQREQRDLGLGDRSIRFASPVSCRLIADAAEDREPDEAHAARDQQHADHELADRPALGDARQERADERRPGHPPDPVEDRPAAEPLRSAEDAGLEAPADEAAEVAAGRGDQRAEDVHGRTDEQDERQQRDRHEHVEVAQELHALADSRDRREHEHRA